MDELVKTFHIDFKLLIAQAINFGVVVWVLYKFAYKPLLKNMNERNEVIKRGLEDAKVAQQHLEKAEDEREKRIIEAKSEAKKILEESKQQAEKNKADMVANAEKETEYIVMQAKKQIEKEKEKMVQDVKKEIGQLVVESTQKVLAKQLDEGSQKEIIGQSIKNIDPN